MIRSTTARFVRIGLLPLVLFGTLLAGCSSTPGPTSEVQTVAIDQADFGLVVGETDTLTATVDVTGNASQDVTWSSDDATVATIGASTGLVTAIAPGTTTLTATSDDDAAKTDTVTVIVTATPAVVSVTVDQTDVDLPVGGTDTLTATVVTTGGASQDVTWSSDDATTASVGATTGVVTGEAVGSADITATSSADGTITDTITVNVTGIPATTISGLTADIVLGSQIELAWTAANADSFDVVCDDGAAGAETTIDTGLAGSATGATVAIPAADCQNVRVWARGAGNDASVEIVPTNVVTRADDYDPYDLQMPIAAGRWPEVEIPGTLRSVLANAPTGSVIGFASDIDLVTLDGVDVENIGTNIDAHLIFRDDVTISGPTSRVTVEGTSGCSPGCTPEEAFTWRSRMAFVMAGTTVTLDNVVLTGGTFIFDGGGVRNDGDLTLDNSVITGNRAWYKGGGIYNVGGATLTVVDSEITGNRAVTEDAEVGANFEIRGGSLAAPPAGLASDGYGGGIWNVPGGVVTVTNSLIDGNEAKASGGGLYIDGGTVEIVGSQVTANQADHNDGYVDYGNTSYGGGIYNGGTLTLTSSTLSDNVAANQGGGLYHDAVGIGTLDTVTITDNTAGTAPDAGFGGGIMQHYYTGEIDNLVLTDVTQSGNTPQFLLQNDDGVPLRLGPQPGIYFRTPDDPSGTR